MENKLQNDEGITIIRFFFKEKVRGMDL